MLYECRKNVQKKKKKKKKKRMQPTKYWDLPVEPKSLKDEDVGEAILPPINELPIVDWCPLVISGGGDGELVLLGRLARELLLLLTLADVVLVGPKASSWSRFSSWPTLVANCGVADDGEGEK